MDYLKDQVLATLQIARKPMKSKDIKDLTGFSDVEIRTAIRLLRIDGYQICSGQEGFWMWDGQDDSWRHTKNQIRSRAMKLMELYNAMERTPETGQQQWNI